MNKYYQPNITEFYFGYQYEMKERFTDGTVKTQEDFDNAKWIKEVFNVGDSPYIDRALYGKNSQNGLCGIRTKYLDIEDIELLGFIKSSMQFRKKDLENYIVGFSNRFDNDLIHVYIDKKYNNIKIIKEEIVLKDGFEELEYETLFKGSCKSINELKLILKLIGYE